MPSIFGGQTTTDFKKKLLKNKKEQASPRERVANEQPGASGSFTMDNGEISGFTSPKTHPVKEQIKERQKDKAEMGAVQENLAAIAEGDRPPSTANYSSAIGRLEAKIGELPEAAASTYENELAKARETFQAAKDQIAKGEFTEKMIHAISQLAAGFYGLKHGIDMSGLEFDKTDWANKYNQAMGEFREELGLAEKQESRRERAEDRTLRRKEGLAGDVERLKQRMTGEGADRQFQLWKIAETNRQKLIRDNAKALTKDSKVAAQMDRELQAQQAELAKALKLMEDGKDDQAVAGLQKTLGLTKEQIEKQIDTSVWDFSSPDLDEFIQDQLDRVSTMRQKIKEMAPKEDEDAESIFTRRQQEVIEQRIKQIRSRTGATRQEAIDYINKNGV